MCICAPETRKVQTCVTRVHLWSFTWLNCFFLCINSSIRLHKSTNIYSAILLKSEELIRIQVTANANSSDWLRTCCAIRTHEHDPRKSKQRHILWLCVHDEEEKDNEESYTWIPVDHNLRVLQTVMIIALYVTWFALTMRKVRFDRLIWEGDCCFFPLWIWFVVKFSFIYCFDSKQKYH